MSTKSPVKAETSEAAPRKKPGAVSRKISGAAPRKSSPSGDAATVPGIPSSPEAVKGRAVSGKKAVIRPGSAGKEPGGISPVKTASGKTAPVKTASVKTASVKTASVKTASVKTASGKTAPVKTRPSRTRRPAKTESGDSGLTAKERARLTLEAFDRMYPDAGCALTERDPFGLLVSTILSAQCTDQRVNMVSPILMKAYPGPAEMASAPPEAVEDIIRSCGFFRMKARNILAASKALCERFGGTVPRSMDELVSLPGVGRKTANCVMANAFGLPALTVDTHLGRIARRIGLSPHNDPAKVEEDLAAVLPESRWSLFSHQGISHGRALCRSMRPLCAECPLDFCDWTGRIGRPA
jgi:endonuclease-3